MTDGGPWRGPDTETWVERIARNVLRDGETLPLIKPFGAPVQEEITGAVGGGTAAIPGVRRPAAHQGWIEAEFREIYGK